MSREYSGIPLAADLKRVCCGIFLEKVDLEGSKGKIWGVMRI